MSTNEKRIAAIAATIADHVRDLIMQHGARAEQSAAEADTGGDKPVSVRIRFGCEWPAGADAPRVRTAITYGSPTRDEAETIVDPQQAKLPGFDQETE
jgi:hypothetical protein